MAEVLFTLDEDPESPNSPLARWRPPGPLSEEDWAGPVPPRGQKPSNSEELSESLQHWSPYLTPKFDPITGDVIGVVFDGSDQFAIQLDEDGAILNANGKAADMLLNLNRTKLGAAPDARITDKVAEGGIKALEGKAPLLRLDARGNVLQCSESGAAFLGHRPQRGGKVEGFLDSESQAALKKAFKEALAGPTPSIARLTTRGEVGTCQSSWIDKLGMKPFGVREEHNKAVPSKSASVVLQRTPDGKAIEVFDAAVLHAHVPRPGIDQVDLVRGHALTEFLDSPSGEALSSAMSTALRQVKYQNPKDSQLTLELPLTNKGQHLTMKVEMKPSKSGRAISSFCLVGPIEPRCIWQDVLSGPVWVVQPDGHMLAENPPAEAVDPTLLPPSAQAKRAPEGSIQAKLGEAPGKALLEAVQRVHRQKDGAREVEVMTSTPMETGEESKLPVDLCKLRDQEVLVDGSQRVVLVADLEGNVVGANLAAQELLESDTDGWRGRSLHDIAGADKRKMTDAINAAARSSTIQLPMCHLGSKQIGGHGVPGMPHDVVVHPRFDALGELCGVMVEAEDTSARMLQDESLRRMLASDAIKPCWALDMQGRVIKHNEAAKNVLNEDPQDVVMHALEEFVMSERRGCCAGGAQRVGNREAFQKGLRRAAAGETYVHQVKLAHNATEEAPSCASQLNLHFSPRVDVAGNVVGIMVAASTPAAIKVEEVDGEPVIFDVSGRAAQMLGVRKQDLIGRKLRDFLSKDKADQTMAGIHQAIVENESSEVDTGMKGHSTLVETFMDISPYHDHGTDSVGALLLMEDMSLDRIIKLGRTKPRPGFGDTRAEDEDVDLQPVGEYQGAELFKFKVDSVKLKAIDRHYDINTLRPGEKSWVEDPVEGCFKDICHGKHAYQEIEFDYSMFVTYLTKHQKDERRLEALRHINVYNTNVVKRIFKEMAGDSDVVDLNAFSIWCDGTQGRKATRSYGDGLKKSTKLSVGVAAITRMNRLAKLTSNKPPCCEAPSRRC